MNAANRSKGRSRTAGRSSPADGESLRPKRRLRMLISGFLIVLVVVGGVYVVVRKGNWSSAENVLELPEIPTVQLDDCDPAIAKLVGEVREMVEKNPPSGPLWGQYAKVLHAHGFADAAHICYDAAARLEPKKPIWPYLQGELSLDGPGGAEAALPHFELAATLSSPDPQARLRVADMLLEIGRLDEADQEYHKVQEVQPHDPQAQLGLGRVAVARRQYREALPYLQSAVKLPQVQNSACTLLASVFDKLGDHASADQIRARLVKMPPDEPRPENPMNQVSQLEVGLRADLERAQAMLAERRVNEALMVLEGAVHHYPDSFEAWSFLCNASALVRDLAGAERAARRGTQLAPKNPMGWLSLANVLIMERRYKDALEPLQKSIALNPKNHRAYRSLGKCRKALGDVAGAAEAFKLAGGEEEQSPEAPPESKEPKVPIAE